MLKKVRKKLGLSLVRNMVTCGVKSWTRYWYIVYEMQVRGESLGDRQSLDDISLEGGECRMKRTGDTEMLNYASEKWTKCTGLKWNLKGGLRLSTIFHKDKRCS